MNKDDRGQSEPHLGMAGALPGLVLLCILVGGLSYGMGRDNEHLTQVPVAYRAVAKTNAQRSCVGPDPDVVFECVYEKVETSQEQALNKQMLSAQLRAANSTLAGSLIAVIALFVTAAGVWLVKRTLDATWQAVEDTARATEAMLKQNEIAEKNFLDGQKPHLFVEFSDQSVSKCSLRQFSGDENFRDVKVAPVVKLTNYSKFPAQIINHSIEVEGPEIENSPASRVSLAPFILPGGESVYLTLGVEKYSKNPARYEAGSILLNPNIIDEIGKISPTFSGFIEYSDYLGNNYKLSFVRRPLNLTSKIYARYGGDDRNFDIRL